MTDLVQRLRTEWAHSDLTQVAADRIAQLETEVQEQCRLNGMGGERELALLAKVERLESENAELRKQLSEQALQKLSDFNQENGL